MAQDMKDFLKQKKEEVALAESVEFLRKNKHFKNVVEKHFYEKEPMRCAMLKGQYNMKSDESQRLLDTRIASIGEFENFLQTISAIGNLALDQIKEAEELPEDQEYEVVEGEE